MARGKSHVVAWYGLVVHSAAGADGDLSTMMWRPAWAQELLLTMEAIAEAFTSLTTTEAGRQAVSIGSPAGRLMRWERPITWTAVGRSASPLKGASRPLIDGRFLQITSLTRGRARFQYAQPKVVRPIGSTFENEETPINRITIPSVRMHFDRTIIEQPIITTYSSSTTEVVATANLTILIGDRSYLLEAAQHLAGGAANPLRAAEFKAARCVELTWVGTDQQGILNALILVDDQVSPLEIGTCLLRPLGRAFGVRGEFKDGDYWRSLRRSDGQSHDVGPLRYGCHKHAFRIGPSFRHDRRGSLAGRSPSRAEIFSGPVSSVAQP